MTELEQCLNVIEGLRRGTCWCDKSFLAIYTFHTGTCQGAVELLSRYGRYVPEEAKS